MSATPFFIKRNELSDGSVLWEVWQNGAELRVGSSVSRYEAADLKDALNAACADWMHKIDNTIDV